MRITRMDLKGFGRFSGRVMMPGPGFNLVYGPNESGKSTLMAFVHAMFYGLRGGRRNRQGEESPLRRFEPWQGEVYQGVLWYALANGDAFRIGRNFTKGTVHLQDAGHNDISARFPLDRDTGPQFAQAQFGVDGETFLHSLMVTQMRTALDSGARRGLMDSLIRMQETGQEELGFKKAEAALKQALLERVGSARSSVRPLDRILERLEQLEQEARDIRHQREESRTLALRLLQERTRVAQLADQQTALALERAACRDAVIAGERMEQLRREMAARERIAVLESRLEALDNEADTLSERVFASRQLSSLSETELSSLPFELGRLDVLQKALAQPEDQNAGGDGPMREALHGARHEPSVRLPRGETADDAPRHVAGRIWLAAAAALLAGVAIVVGTADSKALPAFLADMAVSVPEGARRLLPFLGGMLVLLAGATLVPLFPRLLMKAKMRATGLQGGSALMARQTAVNAAADAADLRRQETARAHELLQTRVRALFTRAGISGDGTFAEKLETLQAAVVQLQADRARLAENGMRREALLSERATLARLLAPEPDMEIPDKRVAADEDAGIRDAASDAKSRLPVLQEALDAVSEELASGRMAVATLETRLERVPQEDKLQQVIEEKDRLVRRRDALETYGAALGVALEEMRAAARQAQQGVSPRLDGMAGEILACLTQGRYAKIGTDDHLSVRVEASDNPEMPMVSSLSGGTADQVWLSVRLAAVRLLERGEASLPLFLDEPFAQYDEDRTRSALQWLRHAAEERQIFLFTCRDRDRQLVAEVFGQEGYHALPLSDSDAAQVTDSTAESAAIRNATDVRGTERPVV